MTALFIPMNFGGHMNASVDAKGRYVPSKFSIEWRPKRANGGDYLCDEHPDLGWIDEMDWGQHVAAHGTGENVYAKWRPLNVR